MKVTISSRGGSLATPDIYVEGGQDEAPCEVAQAYLQAEKELLQECKEEE